MNEINKIIKSFKRKLNINIYINILVDFGMMYFILATAILAVANLYYLEYLNESLLVIGLIFIAACVCWGYKNRKDDKFSAIYLDKEGFDSRFITILQMEDSEIRKYIVEESKTIYEKIKPKYKYEINKKWPLFLILIVLFTSYYYISLDNRSVLKEKFQSDNPIKKEIEDLKDNLEDYTKDMGIDKKEKQYLKKEVKKIKEELKKSNYKMIEKSAEILSKKIKHVKNEKSKDLKKKIMDALNIANNMDNINKKMLEDALENIDMEELMEQMEEIMKNIDSDELKKMAEDIKNSMSQSDIDSLMKSLEDLNGISPGSYNSLTSNLENLKNMASSKSADYKPGGT